MPAARPAAASRSAAAAASGSSGCSSSSRSRCSAGTAAASASSARSTTSRSARATRRGRSSRTAARARTRTARDDCRIVARRQQRPEVLGRRLPAQQPDVPARRHGVLHRRAQTGCGYASSAVGPFYCPADKLVYIDLGFFDDVKNQLGVEVTPFVQAYVIAHEYGHHVQDQLGVLDAIRGDARGPRARPSARSSRPTATPASGPRTRSTPG